MAETMFDVTTQQTHNFLIQRHYNHQSVSKPWMIDCTAGDFSQAVADEDLLPVIHTHLAEVDRVGGEHDGQGELDLPKLRDEGAEQDGDWSNRLRHAIRNSRAWDGPPGP